MKANKKNGSRRNVYTSHIAVSPNLRINSPQNNNFLGQKPQSQRRKITLFQSFNRPETTINSQMPQNPAQDKFAKLDQYLGFDEVDMASHKSSESKNSKRRPSIMEII